MNICLKCGNEFEPKRNTKGRYCSNDCWIHSEEYQALRQSGGFREKHLKALRAPKFLERLRLSNLGKKLSLEHRGKIGNALRGKKRPPITEEWRKHLSDAHKGQMPWMTGRKHTAEARKKISLALRGKKHPPRTPEHRCKLGESRKGKNSPFWKGGIAEFKDIIRHLFEYTVWREAIFKRDNWTCQNCGNRGGKLNADHKKPFSLILKLNNIKTIEQAKSCKELWDINNGRTLCLKCHRETDTWGNRVHQKESKL